jgi:hypothetical protein
VTADLALPPPTSVARMRPLPIEVFDAADDPQRHRGRSAVRRAMLALHPEDGESPLLPGPLETVGGAGAGFWGVRAANDLTVALRTASFADARSARSDAVTLLARADDFRTVGVQTDDGRLHAFWIVLDRRVVLVGGQVFRRRPHTLDRALRDALGRLPVPDPEAP